MRETFEERAHILNRMRAASNSFYSAAANAGCHAFIEFTGLMNEFIKLCETAERQGTNWVHANVHGDVHLPFEPYHVEYLSEKLECIYGRRLQLVDDSVIEPSVEMPRRPEDTDTDEDERIGVVLEYHDGPLRTARQVTCASGEKLVQVETVLAMVSPPFRIGHDNDAREVTVRFDRNELVRMLDIIDGKPVTDFHDRVVDPTQARP